MQENYTVSPYINKRPNSLQLDELQNAKEAFDRNFERHLEEAGFASLAEFARKSNIPYRTLQELKDSRNVPKTDTLSIIAKTLGVAETKLLIDPETKPTPQEALKIIAEVVEREAHLSVTKRDLIALISDPAVDDAKAAHYAKLIRANIETQAQLLAGSKKRDHG